MCIVQKNFCILCCFGVSTQHSASGSDPDGGKGCSADTLYMPYKHIIVGVLDS